MRFLVVDDHPLPREGSALALRDVDPSGEVLQADGLMQAMQILSESGPMDLILLDLDLADSAGIDTLKTLKNWCVENGATARIVVLSGRSEPDLVREVINNYGTGFILKAAPRAIFHNAISLTLAGGVYIPDVVLKQLTVGPATRGSTIGKSAALPLTQRETEIAALLVQGFTYKQIAKELERIDGKQISDHTVRAHVGNIAWKLGVTENAKSGVMAEIARRGLMFPSPAPMMKTHRREVSVVFIDLRGFTAFTDRAEPEEVMELLHAYHAAMGRIVVDHGGTLERFAGDSVMVFFNDPVPIERPAEQAVRMALAMQRAFPPLAELWRKRGFDLALGCGIAQGYATLGAIGFEGRWDYAAIGNVTNLAARLCAEAAGGQVLVDRKTLASIEEIVEAKPVGPLAIKGLAQPVPAFIISRLNCL